MLVIFLPLLGQILTISVCRHIKGVLTIVDDVGGHFGFQVTLTLDSQNNIFIQSDSLDLVGIYPGDIHLINPSRSSTFQVIVNLG